MLLSLIALCSKWLYSAVCCQEPSSFQLPHCLQAAPWDHARQAQLSLSFLAVCSECLRSCRISPPRCSFYIIKAHMYVPFIGRLVSLQVLVHTQDFFLIQVLSDFFKIKEIFSTLTTCKPYSIVSSS